MWARVLEFIGTQLFQKLIDFIARKYKEYKRSQEIEEQTCEIENSETDDDFDRAVDNLD